MKNEENKVNFDLSNLSLKDLIKVYENINGFMQFLEESKIVSEEKTEEKDE